MIEEYRRHVRLVAKPLCTVRQYVDIASSQHEPFLGELDCRRDQHGSRQGAVLLPRGFQAHDGSGNPHRQITVETAVADNLAARVEEHVGAGGERRPLAKIDEGIFAVGEMNDHESAAAEIAAARMCHRQRVADRYRGIDGVATLTQNCRTHIRSQVLGSNHHPLIGFEFQGRGRTSHQARCEQKSDCYPVKHGP